MPNTPKDLCEVHIQFPRELWREFLVYSKVRNTTGSKLIRNSVRKMLTKPDSEMEEIK